MTGQAVFLHRRSPADRAAWHAARSWFGGFPDPIPPDWPRTDDGVPMSFLAQIDLDELPKGAAPDAVPQTGALLFFAALSGGPPNSAVRYMADGAEGAPAPPDRLPPLFGDHVTYYRPDAITPQLAPRAFNRWPIRFALYDEQTVAKAETTSIAEMDPSDTVNFPLRPETMRRLLRGLKAKITENNLVRLDKFIRDNQAQRNALENGLQPLGRLRRYATRWPRIARKEEQEMRQRIGSFERRLRRWNAEREDTVRLLDAIEEARLRLPALLRNATEGAFQFDDMGEVTDLYRRLAVRQSSDLLHGRPRPTAVPLHAVDTIRRTELRDHALSGDAGWASLTEAERAFIEADLAEYLTRPHQMFGIGADIQGYGQVEGSGTILLFQAYYDEPLMWMFGDVGTVQFRIRHDDLNAGRWDAAWADVTSH